MQAEEITPEFSGEKNRWASFCVNVALPDQGRNEPKQPRSCLSGSDNYENEYLTCPSGCRHDRGVVFRTKSKNNNRSYEQSADHGCGLEEKT